MDLKTRELYCGEKPLPITNLGFEVLLFLTQHQGQLVTRDQLADHAWKNKVITDATLYKQIQRLRKLLGHHEENKRIIQTVHGQGFIFLPPILDEPAQPAPASQTISAQKSRLVYPALLALVLLFSWLFFTQDNSQDDLSETPSEQNQNSFLNIDAAANPLVMSLLPQASRPTDSQPNWPAAGGMSYLIEKFKSQDKITIKRLTKAQMLSADAETKAIELTHDQAADVVLVFQVEEIEDQFQAQVVLRDFDGIKAQNTFSSMAIKDLFDQIHHWTNQQMDMEKAQSDPDPVLSEDRYAIENYIRGMGAQFAGNAGQAIQYFELATNEDPQFWKAWYELAIALRKQGQHNPSLAILETLLETEDASTLHLGAWNAKALVLWRLGQHPQALIAIDELIELAKSQNYQRIHIFYTNKAIIASELGDQTLAEQAIRQSINALESHTETNHWSLGAAYNTLAGIKQQNGDYDEAVKAVKKAIRTFEIAGDARFHLTAQSRLASLHIDMGELKLAEQLTQSLLIEQQAQNDVSGQISNWLKIANINLLTGNFEKVQHALNEMTTLFNETSNEFLASQYTELQIRFHQKNNQWHQIPQLLEQYKNNIINPDQQLIYLDLSLAYWHHSANWSAFNQTLESAAPELRSHALLDYWRAQYAWSQNQTAKARSAMQQAYQKVKQMKTARGLHIRILNAYINMLLPDQATDAQALIDQATVLNPPPYPWLKSQAKTKASQGHTFEAVSLLKELKMAANDLWSTEDQLLLEAYRHKLSE